MNNKKTLGKRLAALAGVLTIGLAGLAGPASADDDATTPATGVGNINPAIPTSLTIHKYDGNQGEAGDGTVITDTSDLGNPLSGVEFTITPVTTKGGAAIDLDTPAGWDLIKGVTVDQVTTANGYGFGDPIEVTTVNGQVTQSLPRGLYKVVETGYGDNTITSPAEDFLVTLPLPESNGAWIYEVHVYPKNKVDTNVPTKSVADPVDGVTIGSTVPWTITAPVQPPAPGAITSFVITDTLDSRLSFKNLSITGFTAGGETPDYTVSTSGQTVTITFTETGLAKLSAGDVVTVTLNTTVLSLGEDGRIPNKATVFTNDNGGKTTTKPGDPTTDPKTNWGPLEILKHAAGDKTKTLAGAEFAVYTNAAATGTPVGTFTTDADGKGYIELWVGSDDVTSKDYWIKETKAPAGYLLDETIHKVTVNAGSSSSAVVLAVANTQQDHPNLPLTGATGTLIMTIGGAVLVLIGAGTAVAARKRNNA